MTNDEGMTNAEGSENGGTNLPWVTNGGSSAFPHSGFVINSSLDIRASSLSHARSTARVRAGARERLC